MTREELIAKAAAAILGYGGVSHEPTPADVEVEATFLAEAALDAVGACSMLAERDELERRLAEAEGLLRECSEALHREGWEEGLTSAEIAAKVDDYIADMDVEIAIEARQ